MIDFPTFIGHLKKYGKYLLPIPLLFLLFRPTVTSIPTFVNVLPNSQRFIINGRGWGHGIGLCQWGSNGQAQAGKNYKQILSFYYKNTTVSKINNKLLRIHLASNQNTMIISANGGFDIYDIKTRKVIGIEPKGYPWTVERYLNGTFKIKSPKHTLDYNFIGPIIFRPLKKDGSTILKLSNNKLRYRGFLSVIPDENSLATSQVINNVMMEDYLRGLAEIPYSWPSEALKAQVAAARSYAYRRIGNPGSFDIYNDDKDQVYVGYDREVGPMGSKWTSAVTSTNNQVIIYKKRPIDAYYFSTCGGSTENIEDIWSTDYVPYLRATKCDYCTKSPKYKWTRELTAQNISDNLNADAESSIKGRLTGIEIKERSQADKVKLIRITGDKGIRDLTGDEFRSALGLDSTMFWLSKAKNSAAQKK